MKNLNKKGFTLIELLAVIVIMGILMFVAIPAISRTIENSRRDTFKDTAMQYANQVKTLWSGDGLKCLDATDGSLRVSTALSPGSYYVVIDSAAVDTGAYSTTITDSTGSGNVDVPILLEQGGKSSWGSRDVKGIVKVEVEVDNKGTPTDDSDDIIVNNFYVGLTDGIHGITTDVVFTPGSMVVSEKLSRGDVKTSGVTYASFENLSSVTVRPTVCKEA